MLSLMPLCLFSVTVGYVFCLLNVVRAALDAPIGFEDDGGFHYGIELATVRSRD
jgi:hypothetical protein